MLWTIVAVLLVLWLLGFVTQVGGGLIHLLLLVAGVIFVFRSSVSGWLAKTSRRASTMASLI